MKIDLHCHSQASWDCITPLEEIPRRCRERGISVQAITDHDEIWGAQELARLAQDSELTVIVGEEITTSAGELIGLFLQERIQPGQSARATVLQIREQGGLVLLPHGFDPLKRGRLQPAALREVAEEIDIVEAFNSRVSRTHWNNEARRWGLENKHLLSGGSDAHTLRDIGSAWVDTPDISIRDPADLLQALAAGQVDGQWVHPASAFAYKAFDWARHLWHRRRVREPVQLHQP
jgi:predicted metal-dependent phosphoesterase TrpH